MPSVDQMLDAILEAEGGYVNHKADRGGPTKYGITQATLSSWRGRKVSIAEVKALTIEEAKKIFVARYLKNPRIDQLPEEIQAHVFDASINHGPSTAVKMLQRVVNDCGGDASNKLISVDGSIGKQTIEAVTYCLGQMHRAFHNALVEERMWVFRRIVARRPSQKVFLKGWLRRAAGFRV